MSQNELLLRKYIQNLAESKDFKEKTKRNWMFGAIDFSYDAGLIDGDTQKELMAEYDL